MEERELFSIGVVTYNNAAFLYEMLDSIFMQSYEKIQLIISDDGSRHYPLEEIQAYVEAHRRKNICKVIYNVNTENMGTVAHVEKVFSLMDGEYVMFIAGDDAYHDAECISAYVAAFEEKGEAVGMVTAYSGLYDEKMRECHGLSNEPEDMELANRNNPIELFEELSHRCFFAAASTAYRRSAFQQVGNLSGRYRLVEDWPTYLRLNRAKVGFYFMNKMTTKHRDGGISHGNKRNPTHFSSLFFLDVITMFEREITPYLDTLPADAANRAVQKHVDRIRIFKDMAITRTRPAALKKPDIKLKLQPIKHLASEALISVVVVTYNSGKYLETTLDSIANQNYNNIELIVTDDLSTDNTVEIAQEWIEKNRARFVNTTVVTTQKNTGVSGNCNRGLAAVQGEFVKLIGGDDILLPNYLPDMVAGIGEGDIAFCYLCLFLDDAELEKPYDQLEVVPESIDFYGLSQSQLYRKQLVRNDFHAPAAFYRRSVFETVGSYDENYPMMEDLPFWLKCVAANVQMVFVETYGILYRRSLDSISRGVSAFKIKRESPTQKRFKDSFDRFALDVRYPEMLRLGIDIVPLPLKFNIDLKHSVTKIDRRRCRLISTYKNLYNKMYHQRSKAGRIHTVKKQRIHNTFTCKTRNNTYRFTKKGVCQEKKGNVVFQSFYHWKAARKNQALTAKAAKKSTHQDAAYRAKTKKINWKIYRYFLAQYQKTAQLNAQEDVGFASKQLKKQHRAQARKLKRCYAPFRSMIFNGAAKMPATLSAKDTARVQAYFERLEAGAPLWRLVGGLLASPRLLWWLLLRQFLKAVRSYLHSQPHTWPKRATLKLFSWMRHPRKILGAGKRTLLRPYTHYFKPRVHWLVTTAKKMINEDPDLPYSKTINTLARAHDFFYDKTLVIGTPEANQHPLRRFLNSLKQERAYKKHRPGEKLKIVMVTHLLSCFSAYESIFIAFSQREDVAVTLLLVPGRQPGMDKEWKYDPGLVEYVQEKGYPFRLGLENGHWQSILDFDPDGVFYQTPYHAQRPPLYNPEYSKVFPKVMYTPYGPWVMALSVTDYLQEGIRRSFFNVMWRFFADKLSAERLEHAAPEYCPIMVHSGSPKMDFHRLPLAGRNYCWNRPPMPEGKRVIWMPRWGVEERRTLFMELYEYMLELVNTRQDLDFVMRPHPLLFRDLTRSKTFDEQGLAKVVDAFESPENSCIDYHGDYREGLVSCDFVVADFTSILYEFLPTGKPIIYTKSDNTLIDPRIMDACYVVEDLPQLKAAMEQLLAGEDPLAEKRRALVEELEYFPSDAPSNGHFIANYVAENLRKEWGA